MFRHKHSYNTNAHVHLVPEKIQGVVVLLKTEVPEADRARVTEAARSCPVSALVVEDE